MDGEDEIPGLSAPVRPDRQRAIRLLGDAERVAQSIAGQWARVLALTMVAQALTAAEPGRAARMLADVEYAARTIRVRSTPDSMRRAFATESIATALAALDPGRAEVLAQSITGANSGRALGRVAEVVAGSDPDRAERILASIPDEWSRACALARIAVGPAALDGERALRLVAEAELLARSISDAQTRISALACVA